MSVIRMLSKMAELPNPNASVPSASSQRIYLLPPSTEAANSVGLRWDVRVMWHIVTVRHGDNIFSRRHINCSDFYLSLRWSNITKRILEDVVMLCSMLGGKCFLKLNIGGLDSPHTNSSFIRLFSLIQEEIDWIKFCGLD